MWKKLKYIKEYLEYINEKITIGKVDLELAKELWIHAGHPGWAFKEICEEVDEELSVSIYDGDKAIGVYLLGTKGINDKVREMDKRTVDQIIKEDISKYENKKGIQGVHLSILPEYRKKKDWVEN
jgi:hypothetical protein